MTQLERAARMHVMASHFRDHAAHTAWEDYRCKMLETAAELDLEAAKLDRYRFFSR